MRRKLIFWFLFFTTCDVSSGGFFTIVGPQTAHPGSMYRAYLTATAYDQPAELEVSLSISQLQQPIPIETFVLNENLDREIEFRIPSDANLTHYIIQAHLSTSGEIFEQKIKLITKKYSVLIQTDKAIYKPGDNVQFRILVLDAEMKPYQYKTLSVAFTDGLKEKVNKNPIKYSPKSFVEGSFKLADELNFGRWGMHVVVDGDNKKTERINFEVVDYQLPQFEVFIEPSAKNLLLSKNIITAKVYAKYTFGSGQKFVDGKATVEATTYDPNNLDNPLNNMTKSSGHNNDVTFNMRDLKLFGTMDQTIVKLEATFVDRLTGRSSSSKTFITVHKTANFKFEIIADKEFLTPGQPYKIKALVRDFEGTIVKTEKPAFFKVHKQSVHNNCSSADTKKNMKWQEMDNISQVELVNGIAEFTVEVPVDALTLAIGISYSGSYYVHKVFRIQTKTRENLDLTVVTKRLEGKIVSKVGQELFIQVDATHKMNDVFSILIGKKGIIQSQKHNVNKKKKVLLNFKVSPAMLPSSSLIVYYIQPTGEVIFNQIKLEFEEVLGNFLEIGLKSETVQTGNEASITLKTNPLSSVGLLAVDQKVSFLKASNDIDMSRVMNEISSFYFNDVFNESDRKSIYTLLGKSNAFILTNAMSGRTRCRNTRSTSSRTADDNESVSDDEFMSDQAYDNQVDEIDPIKVSETWIFKSFDVDATGKHVLSEKVPDSLTSYIITGFSMNLESGLGIAEQKKLSVSKQFFIEWDLPQAIFIGEVLRVKAFVYNFFTKRNLQTQVTLVNNEGFFEIVEAKTNRRSCSYKPSKENSKTVQATPDGATEVSFFIRPLKDGLLKLKIVAHSQNAHDEATKQIMVNHNGVEVGKTRVKFIDLRNRKYDSYYFDISAEADAVQSSIQTEASVIGDLMGPALENVDTLLNVPVATTNQKLAVFIPSVLALKYLKSIGKLSDRKKAEGLTNLSTAYQYILSKKLTGRDSGAYSEWNDGVADVETTVFVAKFLSIAKDWIEIDDQNIVQALSFLKGKQSRDGKFSNEQVSQEANRGEVKDDVILTAFTVISFLENKHYVERHKQVINKALNYINGKFNELDDSYALAISSYALALGKHEETSKFLEKLMKKAVHNGDKIFWDENGSSIKIETAAYAILAFEQQEIALEAKNILNWLLTQRSQSGGFSAPKDTVIGLQAVSEMAKSLYSDNFNMNIYFLYEPDQTTGVFIDRNSATELKNITIPTWEGVSVQANGSGVAYVQVWQKYIKQNLENLSKKFDMKLKTKKTENRLTLNVCVKFQGERSENESKMTVVEVSLPNGYEFDDKSIDVIKNLGAKTVQTRNGKTTVNIFFEKVLRTRQTCFDVQAVRWFDVATSSPSFVKVYEYNDKDLFTLEYYLTTEDRCAA